MNTYSVVRFNGTGWNTKSNHPSLEEAQIAYNKLCSEKKNSVFAIRHKPRGKCTVIICRSDK